MDEPCRSTTQCWKCFSRKCTMNEAEQCIRTTSHRFFCRKSNSNNNNYNAIAFFLHFLMNLFVKMIKADNNDLICSQKTIFLFCCYFLFCDVATFLHRMHLQMACCFAYDYILCIHINCSALLLLLFFFFSFIFFGDQWRAMSRSLSFGESF